MYHQPSAVMVVCTVWSATPATMYFAEIELSGSQKSLSQPRDVDAEQLEDEDDERGAREPAADLEQAPAAGAVVERRDGAAVMALTVSRAADGARACRRPARRARRPPGASSRGVPANSSAGARRDARRRGGRCAGTCPSGSARRRAAAGAAAPPRRARGSRCPGGSRGPPARHGQQATSSVGASARMPSKRSVSPAKYTAREPATTIADATAALASSGRRPRGARRASRGP